MSETDLPVFPLPVVLYPGMTLPLHIFEDRYKQLIADIHGVGGTFGIVLVEQDDDEESARLHTIGAIARITELEALPDGRFNLTVQGEQRIRLLDWHNDQPYATAHVQVLEEDTGSENLADLVRSRFLEYLGALFALVRMNPPEVPEAADARALSYWIASILQVTPAVKQALLRCPSTDERLSTLLQVMGSESQRLQEFADNARQQGKEFFGGIPFSVN